MPRLFRQTGFTEFGLELKRYLANNLKKVSDESLISHKDSIDSLSKEICKHYSIKCDVEFNFNVKKAEIVKMPAGRTSEKRYVQYSIPVKGSTDVLTINPFNANDTSQLDVDFNISNGNFQFLIDTNYYGDLTDKQISMAKATALLVEDHINQGLEMLKLKADEYNKMIEREATEVLNSMLPAAIKRKETIDKLNS